MVVNNGNANDGFKLLIVMMVILSVVTMVKSKLIVMAGVRMVCMVGEDGEGGWVDDSECDADDSGGCEN